MQKLEGQLPTWRKWDSPIHPPQAPTPLAVLCTHWAHFSGCSLLPVFKGRPNFGSSFGAERVDFKTFGVVYFRFRPKVAVTFSVIFQIRQLWCQISAGTIRLDTVSRCQIRGGAAPPWFNYPRSYLGAKSHERHRVVWCHLHLSMTVVGEGSSPVNGTLSDLALSLSLTISICVSVWSVYETVSTIKAKFHGSSFLLTFSWHPHSRRHARHPCNLLRGCCTCWVVLPVCRVVLQIPRPWHARLVADMSATRQNIMSWCC